MSTRSPREPSVPTVFFFFFQAEDGIRDYKVTGVQTCALPIFTYGTGSAGALGPGRFRLKVKPTRRVQALLRKGKKVGVSIGVTFSPTGGRANTKTTRINVKLKKGRRAR